MNSKNIVGFVSLSLSYQSPKIPQSQFTNTMLLILSLLSLSLFSLSLSHPQPTTTTTTPLSLSFPLTSLSLSKTTPSSPLYPSLFSIPGRGRGRGRGRAPKTPSYASNRLPVKYSNALIVSLPIGTPPQPTDLVLDTGSQLSWIQCHNRKRPVRSTTASFDPSLSSSFSLLPCNNPLCKPRIPDFTVPTTCDQKRLCHYSYFYADGTAAEGNLVREKFSFSGSSTTPPVILGCAEGSAEDKGILGMNLGRLSFVSQARISRFSYCVPARSAVPTAGSFYLGSNPHSATFKYVSLLTFPESERSPNLDKLAYTLPLQGIKIGGRPLNISAAVFRPDETGSGQTMIDSGSDLTYLVDEAYNKVKSEIVRLVGPRMKKAYVYANVADMCFDARDAAAVGPRIGDMSFVFAKGVEIVVRNERILTEVEAGVKCVGIGRSDMLGIASNIIGNVHQQNMWVEYDVTNRRVGFGEADCSRSK